MKKTNKTDESIYILGGRPAFDQPLHVNKPNIGNRQAFLQRVDNMLDTHWFTNQGPYACELEQRLARYLGTRHCVLTSSGTTGLQLCIKALGLKGEVILPSYTFIATAHALQWEGITPVFCDIDADSWCIDPQACENLITEQTSAILGVHLWGRACHIEKLEKLACTHALKLFFDAAHAFGCGHRGTMIGGFGDAEVFSFHSTKAFHTFEGGAVTTNSDELADKIRQLRNFGFKDYDEVEGLGINAKMPEVSAAMGLANLDAFEDTVSKNRIACETYQDALADIDGLDQLIYASDEKNNYHYVVVEVNELKFGLGRDELMRSLHQENIMARRYFYPGCHRMPPYVSQKKDINSRLHVTNALSERILLLPAGAEIGKDDIDTVCEIIRLISSRSNEIQSQLLSTAV